jgi:hypothetical protein
MRSKTESQESKKGAKKEEAWKFFFPVSCEEEYSNTNIQVFKAS